jgi:hypothetical protein
MTTFQDVVQKLKEINEQGFCRTHRAGNTGIGKTLEDLLGIQENNIPGPDIGDIIELKSARKPSSSMLTLFTKAPLPNSANTYLLNNYGYVTGESQGKHILHTTVNGQSFNTIRGSRGFKVGHRDDKIILEATPATEYEVYWTRDTIKACLENKYPKGLAYVKADFRGSGANEEFHFNEAYFLEGFDFNNFMSLLDIGRILIDIRIGQYSDGRTHDHGTGFRIFPDTLDSIFTTRRNLLE